MNILFAIEYRGNAGNTHAISNYIKVGAELGHNIAFYGPSQPQVVDGWYLPPEMQTARFSTDPNGVGSPLVISTMCTRCPCAASRIIVPPIPNS